MSAGIDNNNPGNLVRGSHNFVGEELLLSKSRFRKFVSMEYGYRALIKTLHTYYTKHNLRTIEGIINRWAPPVENDTAQYVKNVVKWTGIEAATEIEFNKETILSLASAISRQENGIKPKEEEIIKGWDLFKEI